MLLIDLTIKHLPHVAAAASIIWTITQFWLNWHRIRRKANSKKLSETAVGLLDIASIITMMFFLHLFGVFVDDHPNIFAVLFGSAIVAFGGMYIKIIYGNIRSDASNALIFITYLIPLIFVFIGACAIFIGLFEVQLPLIKA